MRNRIGMLLAFVLMLPGFTVPAGAEPVAVSCDATASLAVPTMTETGAVCDEDGRFELLARSSSPMNGLLPGPNEARAVAAFRRTIDPSGMGEVQISVSIDFDEARATTEPWLLNRIARGELHLRLPTCTGCPMTAGAASRVIVESTDGEDALPQGTRTYTFHARAAQGHTFHEPIALEVTIAAIARGTVSGGRGESVLRGSVVSVDVGTVGPEGVCDTATPEPPSGLALASVWCDAGTGTFETRLRQPGPSLMSAVSTSLAFERTLTLDAPARYAVATLTYTIDESHAWGTGTFPMQRAFAESELHLEWKRHHRAEVGVSRPIAGDFPIEGTFVLRMIIEHADGTMLQPGDYVIAVRVESAIRSIATTPLDYSTLDIAGSLGSLTLDPVA